MARANPVNIDDAKLEIEITIRHDYFVCGKGEITLSWRPDGLDAEMFGRLVAMAYENAKRQYDAKIMSEMSGEVEEEEKSDGLGL